MKTKKKPDLKAKLDKVFSEYIRKRDTRNGVFKCISCGRILPYEQADCGHYINRKHMSTRFDEMNCNAQCRSCVTPDTRVLTADLRWTKIGRVKVGDVLFGFDEDANVTSRRYKETRVLSIEKSLAPTYEVLLDNGDKIKTTADHKWLARRGSTTGYIWIETQDLWVHSYNMRGNHITGPYREDVSSVLCKPFLVVEQDLSYEAGWVAGMIDADGHICQQIARDKRRPSVNRYGLRIGISQNIGDMTDKIEKLLKHFSGNNPTARGESGAVIYSKGGKVYSPNGVTISHLVTGTNIEKIQFLQRVRPIKIKKIDINKLGKLKSQFDARVVSITPLGMQEIIVMETESKTFIAEGYAMHNCNRFDEGNIQGYRRGLVALYGEQQVTLLEAKKHNLRKYSDFEYEILIKHYKEEIKKL